MQKFTRIAAMLLVVVAVVLAIVAFALGRRAVRPVVAQATDHVAAALGKPQPPATVSVVAAAQALPAGQPIAASALKLAPSTRALPDGYGAIDAVAGDVPLVDIPAGAAITANLLAHGVATELKPGERALAVPVDELAGAGNRVLPGDYVDVFLSLKPDTAMGGPRKQHSQTRLLLSRLRVLAYGSKDLPAPAAAASATGPAGSGNKATVTQTQAAPPPHTAVLAVPVDEVDRLILGAQDGKLALALRSPGDTGQPDDTLFPQPRSVLSPRLPLTPEQKQALAEPENRAYAGIDGAGLAGQAQALPPGAVRPIRHEPPRVEVIRGTQAHSL